MHLLIEILHKRGTHEIFSVIKTFNDLNYVDFDIIRASGRTNAIPDTFINNSLKFESNLLIFVPIYKDLEMMRWKPDTKK